MFSGRRLHSPCGLAIKRALGMPKAAQAVLVLVSLLRPITALIDAILLTEIEQGLLLQVVGVQVYSPATCQLQDPQYVAPPRVFRK